MKAPQTKARKGDLVLMRIVTVSTGVDFVRRYTESFRLGVVERTTRDGRVTRVLTAIDSPLTSHDFDECYVSPKAKFGGDVRTFLRERMGADNDTFSSLDAARAALRNALKS